MVRHVQASTKFELQVEAPRTQKLEKSIDMVGSAPQGEVSGSRKFPAADELDEDREVGGDCEVVSAHQKHNV